MARDGRHDTRPDGATNHTRGFLCSARPASSTRSTCWTGARLAAVLRDVRPAVDRQLRRHHQAAGRGRGGQSSASRSTRCCRTCWPSCAAEWGGRVIHFSTDCVFSGRRGGYTRGRPVRRRGPLRPDEVPRRGGGRERAHAAHVDHRPRALRARVAARLVPAPAGHGHSRLHAGDLLRRDHQPPRRGGRV